MRSFLIGLLVCVLVGCSSDASRVSELEFQQASALLASQTLTESQLRQAITMLEHAADRGSSNAALMLGYLTLKGNGLTKDVSKALALFEKAGNLGSPDGQYNAGLAYARGDGVPIDLTRAAAWFMKAALQGDAGAQYNLGIMAMNGEGMETDLVAAVAWFTLAAEQGYHGAEAGKAAAMHAISSEAARGIEPYVERLRSRIIPSQKTVSSVPSSPVSL